MTPLAATSSIGKYRGGGGFAHRTIGLLGRKPGNALTSVACFAKTKVSPTRASLVDFIPQITNPTCPVCLQHTHTHTHTRDSTNKALGTDLFSTATALYTGNE